VDTVLANVTRADGSFLLLNMTNLVGDIFNATFPTSLTDAPGLYNVTIIANDTSGNVNRTERTNFTVFDITPPEVINVTAEPRLFNQTQSTNITVNVTDNINVDTVLANITFPNATSRIFTMTNLAGDIFNFTFVPLLTDIPGLYNVTIIANDTSGNINRTETTNFTVFDITPPEVRNVTAEPRFFNQTQSTNITVNVTDNIEVDTVLANVTRADGSVVLLTMTNLVGDIFNATFPTSLTDAPGVYNVTIIANDTSGNVNRTEGTNFTVLAKTLQPDTEYEYYS